MADERRLRRMSLVLLKRLDSLVRPTVQYEE
jgi:hypothetical protein